MVFLWQLTARSLRNHSAAPLRAQTGWSRHGSRVVDDFSALRTARLSGHVVEWAATYGTQHSMLPNLPLSTRTPLHPTSGWIVKSAQTSIARPAARNAHSKTRFCVNSEATAAKRPAKINAGTAIYAGETIAALRPFQKAGT